MYAENPQVVSSILKHTSTHFSDPVIQMAAADVITATFNYSTYPADGSRPYFTVSDRRSTNISDLPKDIQVENIRGKEDNYSLDTAGFKYIKHKSAVTTFEDEDEIKNVYYPESVEVLKEHTGANRVVIFDHSKFLYSKILWMAFSD